jgi:ribosomal protein S30
LKPDKVLQDKRRKKRGGRGSHGAIGKAGKVRMQTPKVPKSISHSKGNFPRLRNQRRYQNREILNRKSGQNYVR